MDVFSPKNTKRDGPEAKIQEAIIKMLKLKEWVVKSTHGNAFQFGFPDVYAGHKSYGARWIEVKNPLAYAFTKAQLEFFHQLAAVHIGVWVLVEASEAEYKKLFRPGNWHQYLPSYKNG